jgi:hypothetical protein
MIPKPGKREALDGIGLSYHKRRTHNPDESRFLLSSGVYKFLKELNEMSFIRSTSNTARSIQCKDIWKALINVQ